MAALKVIRTPKFRLSFPHLITPDKTNDGNDRYQMTMIFSPDEDMQPMLDALESAISDKWPSEAQRPSRILLPLNRAKSLAESPETGYDFEKYPYYEGMIIGKAANSQRPAVASVITNELITDESEIYAGCYCRADLAVYASNAYGKARAGFLINNVFKIAEGEPLAGVRSNILEAMADLRSDVPAGGVSTSSLSL